MSWWQMGVPPSPDPGQGERVPPAPWSCLGGAPRQDQGYPPPQDRTEGNPPPPPQTGLDDSHYAAGGMPLAVTQEDSFVIFCALACFRRLAAVGV